MNSYKGRPESDIPISRLHELFDYDPDTGFLLRKGLDNRAGSLCKKKAGHSSYFQIRVDGKKLQTHRVIWAMHYWHWPVGQIDHIDGNGLNNRLGNLRTVTRTEQHRNKPISKTNKSGVMGVRYNKRDKDWVVRISQRHIGSFKDFFEACCARKSAERRLGYHPNHGRKPINHSEGGE